MRYFYGKLFYDRKKALVIVNQDLDTLPIISQYINPALLLCRTVWGSSITIILSARMDNTSQGKLICY